MGIVRNCRELNVYKNAFEAAMRVFQITKGFPKEEKYSLTDQIRRSSRAVCANLTEAWRKRRYEKHFVSKLTDAAMEADETRTWLQFAIACAYIDEQQFDELDSSYNYVLAQLVKMESSPSKWLIKASTVS